MSDESTAVNLDDPATWPDDIESLEKFTDGIDDGGDTPDDPDSPTGTTDDKSEAADTDAAAGDTAGEEGDASDSKAEEDPKTAEQASEGEESGEETDDDERPIATKDGKHTLPFSVLRAEREAKKELSERNRALEAELEELRSKSGASRREEESRAEGDADEVDAALQERYERVKEEWGPEIADSMKQTWELERLVKSQQEIIHDLQSKSSTREQREAESEERAVQDAIDRNPTLAAWQADEKSPWYGRSVEVHKLLMETDADYAEKSWVERFEALPSKVEAIYGKAGPGVPEGTGGKTSAADARKAVAAAKTKAGEKPPLSASELPAGETPEAAGSEVDRLERMSPAEIQSKMDALAGDPAKLESFLRAIA